LPETNAHSALCALHQASLLGVMLLVAATGCDSIKHRQLLSETQVHPEIFLVDVPVTVRKGLLVVEGRAGDSDRPVELMVDTGAFESKLTASTAVSLGVEPLLERSNSDTFGRSRSMPVGQLDQLRFNGLAIQQLSVGLLDWPETAITPCLAADGLLGANALREMSWSVDFQAPSLKLSSDAERLDIPANAKQIDVTMPALSATPRITATVDGRKVGKLLLDLGSNGGLVLPRKLLDKLDIPAEQQIVVDDAASSGIYGSARQRVIRAPVELSIASLPPIEVMAEFTDDSGAKLGTEVLSHFKLWLDYENRRLSLLPASRELPDRLLPHGVLLGVDWKNDRWKVSYLEYPAKAQPPAQLAIGDQFDTVNGLRPGEVFTGWCAYVEGIRGWLDEQETLELVNQVTGERRQVNAGQ